MISSDGAENTSLHTFLNQTYPGYIAVVPTIWLEQGQPIYGVQILFSVLFLVICIPGNISQLLVLLAYARCPELRTASNRLLISLLVADFILLGACYPGVYQIWRGAPIFGILGCNAYGFVSSVAALAEIWSLSAVSFDRLQAIYHPLDAGRRIKTSQV